MIRRFAFTSAAAIALVLVPSAAMADNHTYGAGDFAFTVPDSTPAAGSPMILSVRGPARTVVTLTITAAGVPNNAIQIAGTAALSKTTSTAGLAEFSVTLMEAGAYTVTATDAGGEVLMTQAVTVVPVGVTTGTVSAPTSAAGGSVAGGGAAAPGAVSAAAGAAELADTGVDGAGLAAGAGALIAAGAAAVVVARKRQQAFLGA